MTVSLFYWQRTFQSPFLLQFTYHKSYDVIISLLWYLRLFERNYLKSGLTSVVCTLTFDSVTDIMYQSIPAVSIFPGPTSSRELFERAESPPAWQKMLQNHGP